MKQLIEKYNLERIEFLKNNKSQITTEILEELRSFGLSGKQIALDILDISASEPIQDIHCEEIEKCRTDIAYFKDNYLIILNKDPLQDKLITGILQNPKVQLTSSRGTKKSYAAVVYALWLLNFHSNKTIGVGSSKLDFAKQFISNATNLYEHLPEWMRVQSRNLKTSMRAENGSRVIISLADDNAFRGISLSCLIIETASTIKPSNLRGCLDRCYPSLYADRNCKVIILEKNPETPKDFYEVNEYTVLEKPVKTERPILKRTLKQIVKDFIQSLYKRIIR